MKCDNSAIFKQKLVSCVLTHAYLHIFPEYFIYFFHYSCLITTHSLSVTKKIIFNAKVVLLYTTIKIVRSYEIWQQCVF